MLYFQLLCIIVPEKGDVGAFANFVASEGDQAQAAPTPSNEPLQASRQPKAPIPTPDSAASAHQAAPPKPQQGRVAATPYARKLAAEKGIALAVGIWWFQKMLHILEVPLDPK